MLATVSGTGAVPCDVAPCGAAPGGVSPDDTGPRDAALCGVTSDGGSPEDSGPCSAAPCRAQGTAAEVKPGMEGDGEAAFLAASVAGGMPGRVSPTVSAGAGDDGSSAPSRSRFFGGGRRRHRDGGGGGVEELDQRLLEHPDAGIDGGKGTADNRARAARGMFTEEASASPLTLTAREQVPKFADLLWHCFGGASTSQKFRGLRIRLFWPDRAPIRHIGKTPAPTTSLARSYSYPLSGHIARAHACVHSCVCACVRA